MAQEPKHKMQSKYRAECDCLALVDSGAYVSGSHRTITTETVLNWLTSIPWYNVETKETETHP